MEAAGLTWLVQPRQFEPPDWRPAPDRKHRARRRCSRGRAGRRGTKDNEPPLIRLNRDGHVQKVVLQTTGTPAQVQTIGALEVLLLQNTESAHTVTRLRFER